MNKLQEIKDQIAQKQYNASFHSICADHFSDMIDEIAERYATEVAKATLERAAKKATLLIEHPSGSEAFKRGQLAYITDDGDHIEIDKQSILETPIELL